MKQRPIAVKTWVVCVCVSLPFESPVVGLVSELGLAGRVLCVVCKSRQVECQDVGSKMLKATHWPLDSCVKCIVGS